MKQQADMTDDELRRVTAHHEAGHAVAAYVGGGTVDAISITPDADSLGKTLMSPKDATNAAFAVHAGPWSEARLDWPFSTFDLDDYEQERHFDHRLWSAWELNRHGVPSDGDLWQQAVAREQADGLMIVHNYRRDQWSRTLALVWPAIEEIAVMLLCGETIAQAQVAEVVERLAPGLRDEDD